MKTTGTLRPYCRHWPRQSVLRVTPCPSLGWRSRSTRTTKKKQNALHVGREYNVVRFFNLQKVHVCIVVNYAAQLSLSLSLRCLAVVLCALRCRAVSCCVLQSRNDNKANQPTNQPNERTSERTNDEQLNDHERTND